MPKTQSADNQKVIQYFEMELYKFEQYGVLF